MTQSSQSGLRSKLLTSEDPVSDVVIDLGEGSAPTARVFQGARPALRNWKIAEPADPKVSDDSGLAAKSFSVPPAVESAVEGFDDEIRSIRSAHKDTFNINTPKWLEVVQYASVFLTVAWLTFSVIYIASLPQGFAQIFSSPTMLGSVASAILAPVAMIWLCVATWQRRSDAHLYAEALRRELQRLLFPTEDQSRAVNRDIQLLVQQAVEISTSSRAALKSIQRARQGLRNEIRDFSGVSQKTEFHIDRLAETLTKRADELLTITDQIEKRSKNISEEVKSGVEVWSEISQDALNKVEEIQNNFDETAQSFEAHTRKISDASDKLSAEADKLESEVESKFTKLENLGNQGISSFQKINDGLEKMDVIASGLFAKSEVVEQNLAKQSETMKQAAADLGVRVADLDLIGTSAAHKLGEALSMALSGSDSIVSAVRRAREQLERTAAETANKATTLLEETDRRIDNLSTNAAERLGRIQELMSGYDEKQKDIADVLEQLSQQNENVSVITDTALDRLTTAVHLLDQSAQTLDIKSSKPVTEIRDATEQLSNQVDRIHESLQRGVADIDVNTTKAKTAAEEIARSLKQHTQDMVLLSGEVTGHAKTINTQFDDHKEKLTSFIGMTEAKIDSFEEKLDRQIDKFTDAVEGVESDIEILGNRLEEKGRRAVEETEVYADKLKTLETRVVENLENLSIQTEKTQLSIQSHESVIRASVAATLPVYEQIRDGVEVVDTKLTNLRQTAEDSTKDIFERMEALSRELEEQIAKLNTEVEDTERNLSSLSGDIKGSVSHIGDSADQATEKLKHLHTTLQGRTEDLQILADQAELKVGNLQKALDINTTEMRGSLARASNKLEEVAEQFEKSSYMVEERAENSARKIETASNLFVEEGHRLAMTGEQTLHKTSRIVSSIQGESVELVDKSKAALTDLQKASDSISFRVREIEEYTKAALNSTQGYNESLKDQVRVISESSSEVVDTISASLNDLQLTAEQTSQRGSKIVDKIETARMSLAKEATNLESVTRKATEAAEEAAGKFTRHSSAIMKSAEDISSHADRIRDLQIRSSREAFLSSAKFIIESLHSLAVDVSRHLEDDVDERSWRAYQKGDVAVFTRRLVQIADEVPMERVRRKFVEDGEFRNYTQRYIRQFEELFESAQNNDHGELLSSIFVSSDVGKLYRLLCDISGRSGKVS